MPKYLLAHDIGTSGTKATLYTTDGKLAGSEVYPYNAYYFNSNWAEQDSKDWWKAVCISTQKLIHNIDVKDIAALSFSGQMMGCLCVDKNGTPLRRAIIWADQRGVKEAAEKGTSPYQIIDRKISMSPAGARGIIFLPYLLGERSPQWNPNAKGAFIGISMEHKREDMLRSILEDVIYNLKICLDIFKKYYNIDSLVVMGGGAKGSIWRQMMVDIYNIRIKKVRFIEESSSTGAAIAGGIGAGIFKDFNAVDKFIEIDAEHNPDESKKFAYDRNYILCCSSKR